ncbi:hypothetical protein M501DRAFT_593989 [Patellaria atrata CBS 101060]|uniref:Uncharacterized protein n=1 Tax=Patellaria atrata CBS 101060 TaxID=1346257 RepID=A0A9P4S1D4_9PEZI|nr:hypothetical protein M501DRAFT_593989 [Patellaria atrata CBS 101060]
MFHRHNDDLIWGWVSSPNSRGSINIIYSNLVTIYLCSWTSLCLNFPRPGEERGWRFLWYKFRWQLITIFFPEVVAVTAAEQWLSACQSVKTFATMGHKEWTVRHGFFADMGGIKVAPPDMPPFPVDSHQLAFLVKNGHLPMPRITTADICALNKADGLARILTLIQMAWFCLSCIGRGVGRIGLSPLELTTLALILCTLHNYFFWYFKPLDPQRLEILTMDIPIAQVRRIAGVEGSQLHSPLGFVNPPPDPKSLVTPFWFGVKLVFSPREKLDQGQIQALPNTGIRPPEGVSWGMMLYLLFFSMAYYALHATMGFMVGFPSTFEWYLWTVSNFADIGLITLYCLSIPVGTYYAPSIGKRWFRKQASSVLDLASMLPCWAKLLVHGPFVFAYVAARTIVLTVSFISLRALPAQLYQDVNWSGILPHI